MPCRPLLYSMSPITIVVSSGISNSDICIYVCSELFPKVHYDISIKIFLPISKFAFLLTRVCSVSDVSFSRTRVHKFELLE